MTIQTLEPVIVESNLDVLSTSLSTIRAYVLHASQKAGLSEHALSRLRLAVDEIATNVLVHGYNEAGLEGLLKISASIDDEMLVVTLDDTAVAFDPRNRETPSNLDNPLETREIGGLGVYLALTNVDVFEYERIGDRNINRFGIKRADLN